jgi:hypothetical protein
MEWMLQVADELDDMVGLLRHGWLGLAAEIGTLLLAGGAVVADLLGRALGAEPALLGVGVVTANVAALLKMRKSRRESRA